MSTFQPATPDVLDEASTSTSNFSRYAAIVAAVLLGIVVVMALVIGRNLVNGDFPLKVENIAESIQIDGTGECRWVVDLTLHNESDGPESVRQIRTVVDRRFAVSLIANHPTIEPGETAISRAVWSLGAGPCPEFRDIDHGKLIIKLNSGRELSFRF